LALLQNIYQKLIASGEITKDTHPQDFIVNIDPLDTNGDNTINQEEFIVAAVGNDVLFNETVLTAGFKLISGNAKYFTIDQLKTFVQEHIERRDPMWAYVKDLLDTNGDG
jgi:hypothetical protein